MQQFRATCTKCDIATSVSAANIEVVPPPSGDTGLRATFTCPVCAAPVSVPIDALTADLLLGSRPLDDASARARHPSRSAGRGPRQGDPPFTPDDLLDLHLLLMRSDWFDLIARDIEV